MLLEKTRPDTPSSRGIKLSAPGPLLGRELLNIVRQVGEEGGKDVRLETTFVS